MKKPKIRFNGYTEDWEQRKLGDLCTLITKQTGFDYSATIKPSLVTTKESDTYSFIQNKDFEGTNINLDTDFYIPISVARKYPKITLDQPSLLISISGRIGNVGLYSLDSKAFIGGAVGICKLKNIEDGKTTLYELLAPVGQKYFNSLIKASSHANITIEDIRNIEVLLPKDKGEKEKINSYFDSLDHLITLHQRKCEETKKLKKYMLQKMFPQNGKNVPEIRFSGFTDVWEQRKLGEYITEYHEITTENNQYPVLTSSRKGIFLQTEYYSGNQVASDDNTGYNIVPYGYFTYRHMSDDEIFHFNINDIVENGIVSTLYPVFTTTDELDSRYLQYQLNHGQEFAKFAALQKQGGSRTYMYLNKLKKLYLTMPKTIEEQTMIGNYFQSLDHLITLHQRKCDELQNLKKFMLQNMFV